MTTAANSFIADRIAALPLGRYGQHATLKVELEEVVDQMLFRHRTVYRGDSSFYRKKSNARRVSTVWLAGERIEVDANVEEEPRALVEAVEKALPIQIVDRHLPSSVSLHDRSAEAVAWRDAMGRAKQRAGEASERGEIRG